MAIPRTREEVEALGYETDGDCFVVALNLVMKAEGATLVHGEVSHSEIPGLRYSHAWIEQQVKLENGAKFTLVIDRSNSRDIQVPKDLYYQAGEIIDKPGKLARYTRKQAIHKARTEKRYGPWDLDCKL